MLGGIFQKRKKIQELRAPALQDIKRFREIYGRHADARHVEAPACFERSIYKAISCQKELHAIDFRQEDVTDPQIIALAETLLDMPLVSSLDLRDNRITDDGAKALLEVLRLQIIAAKMPPKTDPKTKKLVPPPPVPEFTRYVTNVNLKGNEISASVLEEMAQYTELLKREDKRLEIRAALNQIDRNAGGGVDEDDFKAVVKLLTGTEPSKKEVKQLMSQSNVSGDNLQNSIALENVLLAKCSSSPSKKAACPPWEAIVQVRHANIGSGYTSPSSAPRGGKGSPEAHQRDHLAGPSTVQRSSGTGQRSHDPGELPRQAITQVGQVTMTTLSAAAMGTNAAPVLSPPPAPRTSSNTGLSISISDVDGDSSPAKPKADFRPPSSPPPPLPLPQTTSPDRRGTVVSTSSRTRDSFESSGDVGVSAPSVVSEGGASSSSQSSVTNKSGGVTTFARQDSRESYRGASPTSPPSTGVSPKARDDYSMDFSSWRDEDPFGVDHDDFLNSPLKSPIADGVEEIESVKSQEFAKSVGSRLSMASSNRPAQIGGHASGIASPVVNAGEAYDGPSIRGQSDLSSLVYNSQADSGNDNGREYLRTKPDATIHERRQAPIPEPPVVEQEDEEEEVSESVVLDIMKDGKPRNVAQVRHSEFKRGMALQDFPGDVPFRNLVALILSENGLRDLSLFKECRFPCTTVLDLSTNALTKISDEELACFPKLQVLDLSCNRLRVVSGVGKLFDLKALSLCNNQLRNVINIEHLIHLQILRLRSNAITAPSALRLLSLNKMLAHLDLDDNPLMETDDRQRRKVTVHILNIVPTLTTLGSVPIAGHIAKDKRKIVTDDAPMGKSLLEHDECPGLRSTWASNACDILQIVQDRDQPPRRTSYDEDDPYGDAGVGSYSPTRQKKPSREQQRQKDELRSKSVGYRSRGKAPPSPVRAKTSSFEFGPPLPPPQRKSPKKKPVVDPKRAQEQKRRASQLSEPKHPPVDPDQFKQEQRRKSRPTFDVNMSVAERLQLARDKSQRRTSTLAPHAETGPNLHRNSTINNVLHQCKRGGDHVPALIMEIREQSSPARPSSTRQQRTLEFRVEPLPLESPCRQQENNQQMHSLPAQAPVHSEGITPAPLSETSTERKSSLKESLFLQSLAVTDFLSHAEEEISTAHTALNVLLSMCERSPSDPKKLSEYRNSLDALDILDEHESQELYERARHHDDPEKARACSDAFEKLRTLKRCIKELLNKLESHAPGSATIQTYCSELRSTELRDIIDTIQADHEATPVESPRTKKASEPAEETRELSPVPSPISTSTEAPQASPEPSGAKTLHSRLFSSLHSEASDEEPILENIPQVQEEPSKSNVDEDDDFDFLSSDTKMFDDDDTFSKASNELEEPKASTSIEEDLQPEKLEPSTPCELTTGDKGKSLEGEVAPSEEPVFCERNERSLSATSTDITQDIQHIGLEDEEDFDFESELPLEETAANPSSKPETTVVDTDLTEAAGSSHDIDFDAEDDAFKSDDIDWDAPATESPDTVLAADEPEIDDFQDVADAVEAEAAPRDAPVDVFTEEEDLSADAELYEEQQHDMKQDDEDAGEQPDSQEQAVDAEDEDDEEAEVFGDWEKGFDPNTNHYFWFNHETGESQWVPPEGWPYEVDTPFEEDAEQGNGDGDLEGEYEDQGLAEIQPTDDHDDSAQPGSPTASAFEADDDVFSDQDLPDF